VGPLGHGLAALCALGALPALAVGAALRPAWRRGLGERLGGAPAAEAGSVWVHAASVGEATAALGLLDGLRERGHRVAATTMTTTGRDTLRRARPGVPCGLAPLDHPWCVARAQRRVGPAALVLVETELWPARILAAGADEVPVLVVSGRISDRSFPRYRRVVSLLAPLLRRLDRVGARSEQDAERFAALGVPEPRIDVTGDLKLEPPPQPAPLAAPLGVLLGDVPLLVGGSTHAGEEEALLAVLDRVEAAGRSAALVLAPRHPERFDAAASAARAAGRPVRRRSQEAGPPLASGEVLILDSLGELSAVYARAAVAFVGGSWVPRGGHNVLEPVFSGKPVFFGPHTENAREAAHLLLAAGAATRVPDAAALAAAALADLADPVAAAARGRAGARMLAVHRGATQRSVELVCGVLERSRGADSGERD
jgi:3-deoxy-D-manno-octulosonic-acid transferase